MRWPVAIFVLRTICRSNSNFVLLHVEDDVLVRHPNRPQHSVRTRAVIFEAVAVSVGSPLPVKVCLWNPLRLHAIENNRDVGKLLRSMGQRPALRAMLCATTLVSSAIRLNSAHQRPVVTAAHVGVRRATVNHGAAPGCGNGGSVHLHGSQLDTVEATWFQSNPFDLACVQRLVKAPHIELSPPLCQADGEDFVGNMLTVLKDFVQNGFATQRRGTDAHNSVCLLCEEQVVLIGVTPHPGVDLWVVLDHVSKADHVLKPVA